MPQDRSFAHANWFQRGTRTFAASGVGSRIFAVTAHPLDRLVHRWTNGRRTLAGMLTGIPAVILTTTGARSGLERSVPVLGIPHPEGLGVIASNFGSTHHPAWYYNLRAHPEAKVSVDGEEWTVLARQADAAERDALWAGGLEIYPGWRKYEARAGDRHIEAFVLVRE